ncbi:MAG: hypothetical protein JST94_07190 [Bacteroidetes bacterium]|nr:hypothetical protein [Bacteroidota bacterium]MBS1671222.1 hypothetical protein [Bacteroidota bacterium]
MNNIKFDSNPIIHTSGAFLKPMKVIDSNGQEQWLWFVSEFTESSYLDGEEYNPKEFSNSKEDLLIDTTLSSKNE